MLIGNNPWPTGVYFRRLVMYVIDISFSMPYVTAVQAKKQALAGAMRLLVEGSMGAWCVCHSS